MQKETTLIRDVSAVQIPSGDSIVLPIGTRVYITQSLGGTFTIATDFGLARILAQDVDSLGLDELANPVKKEEILSSDAPIEDQVWELLKTVYDPEIPVDIVNLGLVYDCLVEKVNEQTIVNVKMTLTAPGCGMGPTIAADARAKILSVSGVDDASVELVWDPPWNQGMISEEGQMQLGMV